LSENRNLLWIKHIEGEGEEASFLFPRNIGLGYQKKIVQKKVYNNEQYLIYLQKHWNDRDCYAALLSDYQVENQIVDRIFFEFDEKDDYERARKGKIIYYCLRSLRITPYILFSGNRSYHYHLFFDPIKLENPKERIRSWVKSLPLDFLDMQVVGDLRRLTRIPYTFNTSSKKMCVAVPNSIFELPVDEIVRITKRLADAWTLLINPEYPNNVSLVESLLNIEIEKRESLLRRGFDLDDDQFPFCIKEILRELKQTGELSHVKRFHFAAFSNRINSPIEEVHRIFKMYCRDYSERKTDYQLKRIYGKNMKCYTCENAEVNQICPLGTLRKKCLWYPSINLYL